eukprot:Skav211428  [mRNA]  locus=scaffold1608:409624:409920:- [translate_table: standard]
MTTSLRKGHRQPNARDAGEKPHRKPRSHREQLLIWLQGEELFRRSSPLEQSITYWIFSILPCQQLVLIVTHALESLAQADKLVDSQGCVTDHVAFRCI